MNKRNIKTYNRNFSLILYQEDEQQMKALNYIKENFEYALILHTKDIVDQKTNVLKKPHYHVVINIGYNPRNRTAIAKELNIAENYIEGCNKNKMLLYLIHYENPEKYQYNIDEVEGPLKEKLEELIKNDNKSEEEKIEDLIKLIENETIYDYASLLRVAMKLDALKILKQNQYLLVRLIDQTQRRFNK